MKILLIGARGFVGSAVAKKLTNHQVHTLDNHPGPKNHLQADILDTKRLIECFSGFDAVINFVGLSPLFQPKISYHTIHVQGAKSICEAANKTNLSYLAHISALGASTKADTKYLQTKAHAEKQLQNFNNKLLIIRPSLIFDEQSQLIQLLATASLTRLFADVSARMQPVYREDLASWITNAISKQHTGVYELAGPEVLTLSEVARIIYAKNNRRLFMLPSWTAHLLASVLAKLPKTRITADQVRSLDSNNILSSSSSATQVVFDTSLRKWAQQGV